MLPHPNTPMGIIVPDLVMPATGLTLPNAYIAISKSSVVLHPRDGSLEVVTSYNTWTSHEARLADKRPVEAFGTTITFAWPQPAGALADMYAAAYDVIKAAYPGYIDETV